MSPTLTAQRSDGFTAPKVLGWPSIWEMSVQMLKKSLWWRMGERALYALGGALVDATANRALEINVLQSVVCPALSHIGIDTLYTFNLCFQYH
jgi:hypothetical protein